MIKNKIPASRGGNADTRVLILFRTLSFLSLIPPPSAVVREAYLLRSSSPSGGSERPVLWLSPSRLSYTLPQNLRQPSSLVSFIFFPRVVPFSDSFWLFISVSTLKSPATCCTPCPYPSRTKDRDPVKLRLAHSVHHVQESHTYPFHIPLIQPQIEIQKSCNRTNQSPILFPTTTFTTTTQIPTMAISESLEETTQAEGEGDSTDIPAIAYPSGQVQPSYPTTHSNSNNITPMNGSAPTSSKLNGSPNYPLPPPDSLLAGVKQPGLTRGALQQLAAVSLANDSSSSLDQQNQNHKRQFFTAQSPIHSPSPSATSPTDSSWEGVSAPPSRGPSRPPSQPASRAPSMSAGVSGGKLAAPPPVFVPASRERRASKSSDAPLVVAPAKKAGSIHSDKAEGHKFNLKDLLASGPKLHRKSSQRSTSSKRSDSDAGDGRARSTAGDSATSLTQKYGVCQKLAIGKGATSVVRLAHKWDRSEEKLYAIKVSVHHHPSSRHSVTFIVIP